MRPDSQETPEGPATASSLPLPDDSAAFRTGTLSLRTLSTRILQESRREKHVEAAVAASGVSHTFGSTQVLFDVEVKVNPGEIVLMTGPSGSGKTTLLTLVGGLRSLQRGSLEVLGRQLAGLDAAQQVEVRRGLGFIFQGHNLFGSLTALQNVRLGLELQGGTRHENDLLARRALEAVGLGGHLGKKPQALSGGQCQRVAVARALAPRPKLVLADEPTAALDADTGLQVVTLLQEMAAEGGTATILVTHDNRILDVADRIINMVDGRLTSDVAVRESLEVCEFLAKVPAFRRYTPGALAEIAEELTLRKLPSGTSVFRQGDPGDEFYVVWKGRVAIVDEAADERLAVLGPGQFFGEMALVSGKPRNASAVVEEDAELLSLNKDEFQRALQREKDFHRQLRETLTLRSL